MIRSIILIALTTLALKSIAQSDTMVYPDDPHSFAKPNQAVVKHLSLELSVGFDNKTLYGVATWEIIKNDDATEIIFDTKGLTVNAVATASDDDKHLTEYSWGEPDPLLGTPLKVKIHPDTRFVIIDYTTQADAAALQWLKPTQTAGKRHPFLFTQSEAIMARTWIPCQDGPGIRFTYDALVDVPVGLMAVMSASNPTEKNKSGRYHFQMDQPIPSYLMALAVGNLVFKPIGDRTGVYAEPEVIDKAAYEFDEMDEMLAAAEKLYGPYRWDRYDVIVLPPSFPFGGMENPRLTFATPTILAGDRSLVSLVAHEMAHSWSGNLVTNATWDDFWLNEGFTVYFEQRIMEEIYGRDYSEMLASLSYDGLQEELDDLANKGKQADTHLKLDLKGRDPDDGMTAVAYDKGYLFLRKIEETVGRTKFDAFLKSYFEVNAFQSMTTESFVNYLNTNLLADHPDWQETIDPEAWIYSPGLPSNAPVADPVLFKAVELQAQKWKNGSKAKELGTDGWSTHEWLYFLTALPDALTEDQMEDLDDAFGFTKSGNAEIQDEWYKMSINNRYEDAYEDMEEFLVSVGRRKFLTPLYRAMIETGQRDLALKIYKRARPNYHAVSYNTIDTLLDYTP